MSHTAASIIVCCIDFRFQKHLRDFEDRYLVGKTYDLVGFAGATKNLDLILGQIDISVRLHQIKEVYLIHHEECGAYGVESTPSAMPQIFKKPARPFSPNGQRFM